MPATTKQTSGSAVFTPAALKFLSDLGKNNNREWFHPRKQEFDELLHAPLLQFATDLNAALVKDAPEYAHAVPSKALNRIYRDIRFSTDKTPYQTHVSALFPHQRLGKKCGAALYFQLSAKEWMVAAGLYFGETRDLQAVRQKRALEHSEFRAILSQKSLKQAFGELGGESLQKAPLQFGKDHPAADLLKRKQWLLSATGPAKDVLSNEFTAGTIKLFRLLIPFVRYINAPLKPRTPAAEAY